MIARPHYSDEGRTLFFDMLLVTDFEKMVTGFETRCQVKAVRLRRERSMRNLASLLFLHLENIIERMKKYQLGEFEEIVLLTIAILYRGAYGVAIKEEIESRMTRDVSMGALHAALVRLEDKGYIKSFQGETTEDRAGRPRRYFQMTTYGKKALEYSRQTREELWKSIPKISWDLKMVNS